jgi:hypothetical protein
LGIDIDDAKNTIAEMSAYVKVVSYENNDTYPVNTVCAQNISEGTAIHGNDVIEVTVSLGLESVAVPNVLDMDRAEAEAVLKAAGLNVQFEEVVSIDIEGQVLAQDIVADQIVSKGTVVTLSVAVREAAAAEEQTQESAGENTVQKGDSTADTAGEEQPEQQEQSEQQEQIEQVAENVDDTNTNSGNVSVKLNSSYTAIAEQLVEDEYIEYFSDYVDAEYAGQLMSENGLSTGNYMVIAFAKKGHRYYYERGGKSPKSGSSKKSDDKKWTEDEISTKVSEFSDAEGYKKMGMAYYDNGDAIVVLGR